LRESPSRVGWGVITPGRPIYEGGYSDATIKTAALNQETDSKKLQLVSRRGGHSIVMDDGDVEGKDQLIRFRTSAGHQILMSDDGQTLFIIHSNGQSYIELGKEGTIDMYSTNSVNIRTQGDLNLHADNNININAGKDINVASKNLNVNTEKDISFRTGGDFKGYTVGTYTYKVDGAMSMASGGEGSYASGGIMYINGEKVNLNSGATSVTPETTQLINAVAHTDTLFDATKGWASAPGKLLSIVSRAPAHAPWASANQGVNVKVSNNSSDALPPAPSDAIAATNASATTTPENLVSTATASTIPALGSASGALDGSVTATLVGGVAAQAAGAASSVVATGTGIIKDATGSLTAAVGSLAQTPGQLEVAGILKPGSSTLINGLVQGGSNVASAMTNNLFAGAPGAQNLTALAQNTTAQVGAQIANFTSAQSALTKSGIITGNEAAGAVAGLVNATSQVGIGAVKDFVQNAAGGAAGAAAGALNNVTGGVTNALNSAAGGVAGAVSGAIAGGNFAAGIGTNLTSGLGSIATSLGGIGTSAIKGISGALDAAKGIAGSAFAAITKSFKPFKAGVPQDLTAISVKNAAEQAASEASSAAGGASSLLADATSSLPNLNVGSLTDLAKSATGSLTAAVGNAIPGASNLLSQGTSALASLGNAAGGITNAVSTIGTATASLTAITSKVSGVFASAGSASGLGGLPGGASAAASLVNASGALASIPNISGVSNLVKNVSAAALNGIGTGASALTAVAGLATGGAGDALNKLKSLDSNALVKGLTAGNQSLASLASLGMPAGAAAALQAGINALSTPGSIPITLPTVATGTNNRGQINAQLTSVLGSSKIPIPDYSAEIQKSKDEREAKKKKNDEIFAQVEEIKVELKAKVAEYRKLQTEWHNLRDTLPEGTPEVATAYQAYSDAWDEGERIKLRALKLLNTIT
jgi:hypothetical protein